MKLPLVPDVRILHYAYRRRMRNWNFSNVVMPYWRFYWDETPGAVLKTSGKSVELNPDSIVVVPSDTVLFSSNFAPVTQFYIHFTAGPPFDKVRKDLFVFDLNDARKARLVDFIRSPNKPFHHNDVGVSFELYSLLFDMLSLLPPDSFIKAPALDSRIQKAVSVMEATLSSPLSNNDLASRAYMSETGFIRLFSEQLGLPPQKYYKKKRIDESCLLLHFSDKRVEDIARELGFVDRYHFSREFKKVKGVSPVVFRKDYAS